MTWKNVLRANAGWERKRRKERLCKLCGKTFKPIDNGNQVRWCIICVPDKQAFGRATRYNITQATYDAMLAKQGNACAICGRTFVGLSAKLIHIDHCHETGVIRGVLCKWCNLGLGWFKTVELLSCALNYLKNTRDT
jgi:hypothetical protein